MPGRHPASAKSLALHYGSCLLSLKLRFVSQAGDLVFNAARTRILLRSRRASSGEAATLRSIRDEPSACAFRGRTRNLPAARFSSETARMESTTLAHSSNCRYATDCVPPHRPNPDSAGVTRFAAGFAGPHHFRSRVTDRRRSPPDSRDRIYRGKRFPPGEPVTSALGLRSERSKAM